MGILDEFEGGFVAAWGDKFGFAYLFRKLKPVTPDMVRAYITENRLLFDEVNDGDWPRWRQMLESYNLTRYITKERFVQEFQKRRPDLYEMISSEANGPVWLDTQVVTLRIKLGIDAQVTGWSRTSPPS